MTTTAEKIKELTINLANLRQQADELDLQLQELCFSPDPPDPEPLEYWVNQFGYPKKVTFWSTKEQAQDWASTELGVHRTAVHMREVTPQDEQDRKDAARYREAKLRQFSLHGSTWYKWDEIIDKAMESDER